MKTKKNKLYLFGAIILVLNYAPMLYVRIFGNGGDFVKFYYYVANKNLISKINNGDLQSTQSIIIEEEHAGYLHVVNFDKFTEKYFHTWISTNPNSDRLTIVFYGVSKVKDKNGACLIKRDYGLISRIYYTLFYEKKILSCFEELGELKPMD